MKKIIIPKSQKDIIVDGLDFFLHSRKLMKLDDEGNDYVGFDLIGLIGLMKGDYEISVELTEKQVDGFTSEHGVDFPEYDSDKKEDEVPQFDYLAEIDNGDDNLLFDVRSNVQFVNSEIDDDSFIAYYKIKQGKSKVIKGTPYVIVSTKDGWIILKQGVEVGELEI